MIGSESSPNLEEIQKWANDPEVARSKVVSLLDCLGDEEKLDWATEALENCGAPEPTACSILKARIQDANPDIGYWSCILIGRLGQGGCEAESDLVAALNNPATEKVVKQEAAKALGEIGGCSEAAKLVLQTACDSPDPRLSRLAAEALQKCS